MREWLLADDDISILYLTTFALQAVAWSVSAHFHLRPALPEPLSKHVLVSFGNIEPTHAKKSLDVVIELGGVYVPPPPPPPPPPSSSSPPGILRHLPESNWSVSNEPPVQVQKPRPPTTSAKKQHATSRIMIALDILYGI